MLNQDSSHMRWFLACTCSEVRQMLDKHVPDLAFKLGGSLPPDWEDGPPAESAEFARVGMCLRSPGSAA